MLKRATTLIAVVAAAFSTGSSGAATTPSLCVGSKPDCFTSIQAAVDAAQDGNTIRIGEGTFAGGITIDKSVELAGRRGRHDHRGWRPGDHDWVGAGKPTVSISGVTITGGLTDFPGLQRGRRRQGRSRTRQLDRAAVTISNSVIAGNVVAPKSTFSSPAPCGSVPFDECAFAGAVGSTTWNLTVIRTRISGNKAGGGVTMYGFGGGIANHPQGTVTLRRSVVTGNRAVVTVPNGRFTDGGGITDGGVLTIEDSVVSDNSSEVTSSVASTFPFDEQLANAGGIYITGSATTTQSTIGGNSALSSNLVGDAQRPPVGSTATARLGSGRKQARRQRRSARASCRPPQAPQSRPSAESRARASRPSVTARSAATAPPLSAP